ncbi:MAG: OmpA family protein [Chitinophagales bacterium]|nr:OmpA family protein [Chitinophagales bacterium]
MIKYLYIILVLFLLSACSSTAKIKDGATAYNLKHYTVASKLLQKDFSNAKSNADKIKIAQQIAQSFEYQQAYQQALDWNKKAFDIEQNENTVKKYINSLKSNSNYNEALTVLNQYVADHKSEKVLFQKEIDFLSKIVDNKSEQNFVVKPLNELNSSASDFASFKKDNTLYFSSTRNNDEGKDAYNGEAYTKIYQATIDNDTTFSNIKIADYFNAPYHNAELVVSKDGKEAYFTKCGSKEKETDDYCHIYQSFLKENGSWSTPQRLTFFNEKSNEGQPYLSPDNQILYFTSDVENQGYGGRDIYFSKKDNEGNFTQAINLGRNVNTKGEEYFPTIADDNTLYFSSNGHIGYGGLDIFSAKLNGKIYDSIQNIGEPFNSNGDDFYIQKLPNKSKDIAMTAYLTSNRFGNKDDILFVESIQPKQEEIPVVLPKPVIVCNILVEENQYQELNNPSSTVIGKQTVQNATIAYQNKTVQTNELGQTQIILSPNQNINFLVSKDNYLSKTDNINTQQYTNLKDGDTIIITKNILLQKIFKDVEIVLENIYYDYNKANIRKDAEASLNELITILKENPSIKIELASNTDCRGTEAYNQKLSQQRAESVVNYLVQNGISADRLVAKGYGENNPIEKCNCTDCTEEQHQKNRRTSFKILNDK